MRYFFLLIFGLVFMTSFAQEEIQKTSIDSTFFTKVDSLYREDQFYIGMTYNLLTNAPKSFRQNGFSAGFSGGFLRDMPINKDRTLAVAIGAGLAYANYQENLVINNRNSGNEYTLVSNSELKKGELLINLASTEYFKVIDKKALKAKIIDFEFKQIQPDGKLKTIVVYTKHARGLVLRFCAEKQVKTLDEVKAFNYENYLFDEKLSTETNLVFTR